MTLLLCSLYGFGLTEIVTGRWLGLFVAKHVALSHLRYGALARGEPEHVKYKTEKSKQYLT